MNMRVLDDISQRSGTQLKSNVKKVEMRFLIIVPDDVGMIVGLLEDGYFASGQGYEILEETFDGYSSTLE